MMPMEYGCLFCATGHEKSIVTYLAQKDIAGIFPVKIRYRRHDGIADLEEVPLFPSYVFFTADPEKLEMQILRSQTDIIRILCYGEEIQWPLTGADRAFAEELFSYNGEIGLSTAYYVGDRIHIENGFLKNMKVILFQSIIERKQLISGQQCMTRFLIYGWDLKR